MSESCLWIESSDGEMWETECGNGFVLNDGTPQNNCMLYCCYCGKSLRQMTAAEADEEDWARAEGNGGG